MSGKGLSFIAGAASVVTFVLCAWTVVSRPFGWLPESEEALWGIAIPVALAIAAVVFRVTSSWLRGWPPSRRSLAVLNLVVAVVVGVSVWLVARPIPDHERVLSPPDSTFKNVATGLCLDSDVEGKVYTLVCNSTGYQNWEATSVRDGYTVKNKVTGYCLDSDADRDVYAWSCNGSDYQKWAVSKSGGSYRLKDVATGFCLDSNTDGEVYTRACSSGSVQQWR